MMYGVSQFGYLVASALFIFANTTCASRRAPNI